MNCSIWTVLIGSGKVLLRKGGTCSTTGCHVRLAMEPENTHGLSQHQSAVVQSEPCQTPPWGSNLTYQSKTVNLTLSHIEGNYGKEDQNSNAIPFVIHVEHLFDEERLPSKGPPTFAWRFSIWFHSGFAFFSIIWVHSWRQTEHHIHWWTLWHVTLRLKNRTFLPAKRASKKGSTRFFLFPSPPKTSLILWMKASSTTRERAMTFSLS